MSFETLPVGAGLQRSASLMRHAEATGRPALGTTLLEGRGAILGSRQRASSDASHRRATTGRSAILDGRALLHSLALPSYRCLIADATATNFVNRYIRCFLRGYTKTLARATYFGTDVMHINRLPAGVIGLDVSEAGTALLELFVGVDVPAVSAETAIAVSSRSEEARYAIDSKLCDPLRLGPQITKETLGYFNALSEPFDQADASDPLGDHAPPPGSKVVCVDVPIGELCGTGSPPWLGGSVLTSNAAMNRVAALIGREDVDEAAVDDALGDAPLIGAQFTDLVAAVTEAAR